MTVGIFRRYIDEYVYLYIASITDGVSDFTDAPEFLYNISASPYANLSQLTSTGQLTIPADVTLVDITVIGGGGSGGAYYCSDTSNFRRAAGGGSGYVKKYTGVSVTPETAYSLTIGKGGTAYTCTTNTSRDNSTYSSTQDGAASSITIGATTYTANGGYGGGTGYNAATSHGGNGGSGGGAPCGLINGATDGGGGETSGGVQCGSRGTGQGSTYGTFTELFIDSVQRCGGGGGTIIAYPGFAITSGTGSNGGGNGNASASTSCTGYSGINAYGGGGGACISHSANAVSGAGGSGLIIIKYLNPSLQYYTINDSVNVSDPGLSEFSTALAFDSVTSSDSLDYVEIVSAIINEVIQLSDSVINIMHSIIESVYVSDKPVTPFLMAMAQEYIEVVDSAIRMIHTKIISEVISISDTTSTLLMSLHQEAIHLVDVAVHGSIISEIVRVFNGGDTQAQGHNEYGTGNVFQWFDEFGNYIFNQVTSRGHYIIDAIKTYTNTECQVIENVTIIEERVVVENEGAENP